MESGLNNQKITNKMSSRKKDILDFIKYIAFAIIIVVPIRMFVAQPFIVSGESMYSTFLNGDYLIVDEISYHIGKPQRGDVIVFKYPLDTKRFFIKRIVGMPNEDINIKEGVVTIKNGEHPDGFILNEDYLKQDFVDDFDFKTDSQEYFVLGDNRSRSSDSRSWGALPQKLIIGRAFVRLLPLKDISYLPGNTK